MVWFKVDDTLTTHPKARAAGLAAMGLWVVSGAYASQHLTEGYVPGWYVRTWPNGVKLARVLVDVGLWCIAEDGWRFHEWHERQPSKEDVLADREANRIRQAEYRARRRNAVTNGATREDVTL